MKSNTRFIQSIMNTAETKDVVLPWSRGKRRIKFIASRAEYVKLRRVGLA